MAEILVYTAGTGGAAPFAVQYLKNAAVQLIDHPSPDVTHLFLDVPCREIPPKLLERLPEDITITGGKLEFEELSGYRRLDLLKNEEYLAKNAAITADCALRVAAARMNTVFSGSSILVIGWGRIGKCLASLLKSIGCQVTVAARKPSDRAMLKAIGYDAEDSKHIQNLGRYDVIFNTVPFPILKKFDLAPYPDILKIDLASRPGLEGADVIWARGLPGLYAPASSGKLIAEIFLKEVTA